MAWWDKLGQGIRVQRVTYQLAITAGLAMFSVAGGRVLLTAIVGEITEVVNALCNVSLQANPTVATATTTVLCAPLNVNGYTVGNAVTITGVPTDAMIPAVMGSALPMMTLPVMIPIGDIEIVSSAAPGTGQIQLTLWYKPLDDAGYVVAA